ncbi:MAG: phytoene dehydrogenase [Planctomycetota bacterium]|nr:MAG: phytoene dehydrogenase [Planctomycetota bacterium]
MPAKQVEFTSKWLKDANDEYDVVVIGSGLGGLTSANIMAREGHSVLLLEHHYNLGGLATWFYRKKNIFDISLHGFPKGMIKTCRKYWSKEIADSIIQLPAIRFDNPQFSFTTTFDRKDFTDKLINFLGVKEETVNAFYDRVFSMNFFEDADLTTKELFEEYFPGNNAVHRLLMEPIAYANGSTLDDPAITYGIVFSNFMKDGVFTFNGGTDKLITAMKKILESNGVHIRTNCQVEKINVENKKVKSVITNGVTIKAKSIISNANIKATLLKLVGEEHLSPEYLKEIKQVRMNHSSTQVYMALKDGESIPNIGDLFFTSTHPTFDSNALKAKKITSRTYSIYYPEMRPNKNKYVIVSSTNALYEDWANLSKEDYEKEKEILIEETIQALEVYLPDIRNKLEHIEAGTPCTIEHYTRHLEGSSFGTKFEGLAVSQNTSKHIEGLFHAGSVGIIMSGWLGTANYGVITANKVALYLSQQAKEVNK